MLRTILKLNKQNTVSLIKTYETLIKEQNMNKDLKQIQVISQLQRLNDELVSTHPAWKRHVQSLSQEMSRNQFIPATPVEQKQQKKRGFFNFFSKQFSTAKSIKVKGLYLYGGSGSGKSFLSDLFFDNLAIQQKKKTHFHQFMASIHRQLFILQKQKKGYDPLVIVARKTAKKTRLLYLDQFQVTDVADASILRRLFQKLISNQMVLLATTNRPPDDLYLDGHQRQLFLPFIDFIKQQCVVKNINSQKDYRYELQRDESAHYSTYISPVDHKSEVLIKKTISYLTGQSNPYFQQRVVQPVPGRKLIVPRACNLVCVYYFNELMQSTMGDSDFRAICKNFKAIVIRKMRKIQKTERNIANRLIKLFDQAYFRNVKVYIQAEVDIDDLITPVEQSKAANQEDFAMIRCKSRLFEFQTVVYQQKPSFVQEKLVINNQADSKASELNQKQNQELKKHNNLSQNKAN